MTARKTKPASKKNVKTLVRMHVVQMPNVMLSLILLIVIVFLASEVMLSLAVQGFQKLPTFQMNHVIHRRAEKIHNALYKTAMPNVHVFLHILVIRTQLDVVQNVLITLIAQVDWLVYINIAEILALDYAVSTLNVSLPIIFQFVHVKVATREIHSAVADHKLLNVRI